MHHPEMSEFPMAEAMAAEEWFMQQVYERRLTLPKNFIGMKEMILRMKEEGDAGERSGFEIAQEYLEKISKSY